MEPLSLFLSAGVGAVIGGLALRYHQHRATRRRAADEAAAKRRRRSEAASRGNRTRAANRAAHVAAKMAELNAAPTDDGDTAGGYPA